MTPSCFERAKAAHAAGDLDGAAELYARAAAESPADHRALHNLGAVMEALGRHDDAASAYRRALEIRPDSAWTVYNLARTGHLAGDLDAAETGYRRSLELDPSLAEACFNLGRLLLERGDAGSGETALRQGLGLDPDDAGALSFLGDALFAQRRVPEALAAYRRTVELEPLDSAAQYDVAKSLESMARLDEAVSCYRRCVELEPTGVAGREGLIRALDAQGHRDQAVAETREWLSLAPGHPAAVHLLASLGAAEPPARASDAYVRGTFDRFAADFDATLDRLAYRAPQLWRRRSRRARGEPHADLDILDLGCGTGLCASHLRPFARRLEGVDLSAAMLARARRRGGYDALHEAELTRFLSDYASSWDVIAAADTLCYFGALEPVLRVAARALRVDGLLVFTLERREGGGVALEPHGRYAHGEDAVRGALAAAGLDGAVERAALRREGGLPVEGMVVTARASSESRYSNA